jgi:anti-anti-sigma regulatory factor
MVFSFFKKKLEKVPEREVVRPRAPAAPAPAPVNPAAPPPTVEEEVKKAPEPLPDLEFTPSSKSLSGTAKQAPKPETPPSKADLDHAMSEFEREYTESNVMAINVDHGVDSLQSDVEQVVVLYANGQDAIVRPLLESLLDAYPGTEGLRLWLMLFDYLQLAGDRAAFDKLGVEFVQSCEMSPPAWRQLAPVKASAEPGVAVCALQGMLTSDDATVLAPLADAAKAKRPLRVDCSRLLGCDDEIAGRLAELLMSARRHGVVIVLEQIEGVIPRIRARLNVGEAQNARTWILLLELLQRHGTQDEFELCAIDFAVTFERSPPSWESVPLPKLPAMTKVDPSADKAHYLSGEIKNSRFEDLAGVLNLDDNVILDFSAVRRIDFVSAGQLVNRLAPVKESGREVIIRSPNHLVAELMAVIGLNKVARIIIPKS